MAHPLHIKARAMAMLALGNPPGYVAEVTGIPRRTIRRWQDETFAYLRDCLRTTARGREFLQVAQSLRRTKTATKKGQ